MEFTLLYMLAHTDMESDVSSPWRKDGSPSYGKTCMLPANKAASSFPERCVEFADVLVLKPSKNISPKETWKMSPLTDSGMHKASKSGKL